jgi:prepilin-type N-terminal cleavage/methylation domain-containing protein
MSSIQINRAANRRGLTLIEMVVVLTILVAVGSLLVPMVGNGLTRSRVATCAANIPAINRMLQTQAITNGDFGDGWSTGVFASDVTGGGKPVNAVALTAANGDEPTLVAAALTPDEVTALQGLGMTKVYDHGDPTTSDYNVTFNNKPRAETIGTNTLVITLSNEQARRINLPETTDGKYIWLGIDKTWSHLGDLAAEPPVHFGDTPGALPHEVYSRFGAIFKIEGGVATFKLVSFNISGDDNFETADNQIKTHWQQVN